MGLRVSVAKFVDETNDVLLVELPNGREIPMPWEEICSVHRAKGDSYVRVMFSLAERENLL